MTNNSNKQPQAPPSVEATDIEHLFDLLNVFKVMPDNKNNQRPYLRATL